MPLLYYWRGDNYRHDLDFGAGYHLNQSNKLLHEINLGESLWAFTRRSDGIYVLAAELVVKAKTFNPDNYRYGRYRVWGDLRRSRYFRTDSQIDVSNIIRSLSVRAQSSALGQSFQGHAAVRRIDIRDDQILAAYAKNLPLEPRARLIPEERLEALLISDDPYAVRALIKAESYGIAEDRQRYFENVLPRRNRQFVEQLQGLYDGRCQICEWAPRSKYQADVCEAHHIKWLSRGGEDSLNNMVLICPNHHRAIHRLDAPFDFGDSAFVFTSTREGLMITRHDLQA
jgi:5-methylcytosine-specific restriction enzyme A